MIHPLLFLGQFKRVEWAHATYTHAPVDMHVNRRFRLGSDSIGALAGQLPACATHLDSHITTHAILGAVQYHADVFCV